MFLLHFNPDRIVQLAGVHVAKLVGRFLQEISHSPLLYLFRTSKTERKSYKS